MVVVNKHVQMASRRNALRYPDNAWEVLLGYDQEKFQGARAGEALVKDLKAVDSRNRTPADDI